MTKTAPITKRLLRMNEAAQYLSMSTWKIRRLVQDRQLPVIANGENAPWLLDRNDLDAWVDQNKQRLP